MMSHMLRPYMFRSLGICMLAGLLAACQQQPSSSNQSAQMKIGKPYVIDGKTYYPEYDPSYDRIGEASWYGPGFHGKYTANGEVFNQNDLTAAHPTLPMPSLVRVTNLTNGRSLVVRINDRGPFKSNRIIDLSKAAAQKLGVAGVTQVRVQFLKEESAEYLANLESGGKPLDMLALNETLKNRPSISDYTTASTNAPVYSGDAAPVSSVNSNELRVPPIASQQAAPVPITKKETKTAAASKPASKSQAALIKEVWADEGASAASGSPQPVVLSQASADVKSAKPYSPPPAKPAVVAQPQQAPAVTAAVAAKASPASGGALVIQAGSFSAEANAQKLTSKLSGIATVAIDKVVVGDKTWFRVRLGPFKDRQSAEAALSKVHSSGVPDARIARQS
jgi:rare lipoprotein A